jgi:hypothetical protein
VKAVITNCKKWRKEFGVDDIVKYIFLHFFEILQLIKCIETLTSQKRRK